MTVWLLIDSSHSMFFGSDIAKDEAAAALLMTLGLSATRVGDLFGIIVFDNTISKFVQPTQEETALKATVEFLVNYQPPIAATNLNLSLLRLIHASLQDALVVVISDFCFSLEKEDINLMKQISASPGATLLSLILQDEQETEFKPYRFIADARDAESNEALSWDLSSRSMRAVEAEYLSEWRDALIGNLKQANSEYLFMNISGNYARELARYFAKKKQYEA